MESKEAPVTTTTPAKGMGKGQGGARRHRNQKQTGLTCEQLRRDVSKSRVLEFLYCAGVPSTEWKNDIRLRVGIEYSAQVMDILQDVVKVATSRSEMGKNAIVMKKDVDYAFDTKNPNMAAKGRTPIIGEVKREKKRRGGGSSDTDSVSSNNKRARIREESDEHKEPAPIEPAPSVSQ